MDGKELQRIKEEVIAGILVNREEGVAIDIDDVIVSHIPTCIDSLLDLAKENNYLMSIDTDLEIYDAFHVLYDAVRRVVREACDSEAENGVLFR